ncbi:acetyl-CoA carboxylase, biotin carboxyl carrier protein [Sesbania bispinosa]|nr:acetyl-CoA carboxylase, biotin carboxyl carrier protein [Sesbania bispinosa]
MINLSLHPIHPPPSATVAVSFSPPAMLTTSPPPIVASPSSPTCSKRQHSNSVAAQLDRHRDGEREQALEQLNGLEWERKEI